MQLVKSQFILVGIMKIIDHSHSMIIASFFFPLFHFFFSIYKYNFPFNRNVRAVDNYLEFSQITPSDAGRYYCSAENRHGNVTKTAEVIVQHNEVPDRHPQPTGRVQEVLEGETVSLDCHAYSSPGARVS